MVESHFKIFQVTHLSIIKSLIKATVMLPETSPCSILSTTIDICTIVQQHLDNLSPAPGGRLMESCVTGIITPIDLPDVLFETILDYILQNTGRKDKLSDYHAFFPLMSKFLLPVNMSGCT